MGCNFKVGEEMNRKQIDRVQKHLEEEIEIKESNPISNWIIIVALGIFLAWLAVMAATS